MEVNKIQEMKKNQEWEEARREEARRKWIWRRMIQAETAGLWTQTSSLIMDLYTLIILFILCKPMNNKNNHCNNYNNLLIHYLSLLSF